MDREEIIAAIEPEAYSSFVTTIGEVSPSWREDVKNTGVKKNSLTSVVIDGVELKATDRFLVSAASRFGYGNSIFTLFTPQEVFERVQEVHPRASIRVTAKSGRALAVSDPDRPLVDAEQLVEVLTGTDVLSVREEEPGVIFSIHPAPEEKFEIRAGETFLPQFTLYTPVDGYGRPATYLSLLREVCENGAVMFDKAFKSEIQIGKDEPAVILHRFLQSFNNEEGFMAIRQRLESAMVTAASIHEVGKFRRAVVNSLAVGGDEGKAVTVYTDLFSAITDITGDFSALYNVGSELYIPVQRQRVLNTKATMYALLNMASELSTHHSDSVVNTRPLNGWMGSALSQSYDLEGVKVGDLSGKIPVNPESRDFYFESLN